MRKRQDGEELGASQPGVKQRKPNHFSTWWWVPEDWTETNEEDKNEPETR